MSNQLAGIVTINTPLDREWPADHVSVSESGSLHIVELQRDEDGNIPEVEEGQQPPVKKVTIIANGVWNNAQLEALQSPSRRERPAQPGQ